MANEDYRVPPQSGHPAAYDQHPSHIHASSFSTSPTSQPAFDSRGFSRRGPSNAQNEAYDSNRYNQARQPINDAVSSAIGANEASANALPPEILHQITSQITENVMQRLKASNLPVPLDSTVPVAGPMDNVSSHDGSPPIDRAAVYTPPSPYRASEEAAQTQTQLQPQPPSQSSPTMSSRGVQINDRGASSPFSQGSHADDSDARDERASRPKGPKRISTSGDATILEKIWGALFTEQNKPTARLGQFLRGIAVHLIEDYEPKHSLVITPSKLQNYYQETMLEREIYPWQVVFDDRTSSISRMFRDIEAEHHLVQESLSERPDTPGLTPRGFETWATLLLQAHPDQEFERLAKTALDMPISNPDDKKERFPKELSRRLFPKDGDHTIGAKLQKSMATHCNIVVTTKSNSTATGPESEITPIAYRRGDDGTPHSPQKSSFQQPGENKGLNISPTSSRDSPPPGHYHGERRRQPYSNAPSEVAADEDTDDVPTPQPIERERKPYVAQPGGGKHYDSVDRANATEQVAPGYDVKVARTMNSNLPSRTNEAAKSKPTPIAIHQKPPPASMDPPDSRRHRSNSILKDQPRSGRNRSPSMSKDGGIYRHSEPDTTYGSYPSMPATDSIDDQRKYRDYEAHRERLAGDRYDAARMAAYDPRERERDMRPRVQSVAAFDIPRVPQTNEEEYYRGMSASYPTARDAGHPPYSAGPHYPPNAYREVR